MRECIECKWEIEEGMFCGPRCEGIYKTRADMQTFVCQVVNQGGCPGYYDMSRKEQRAAMREWRKEQRA